MPLLRPHISIHLAGGIRWKTFPAHYESSSPGKGQDGQDVDDAQCDHGAAHGSFLHRSAGRLFDAVPRRHRGRSGRVPRHRLDLFQFGGLEAHSLRIVELKLPPRMQGNVLHVSDEVLSKPRLHDHDDVDIGQEEPRGSD